MRNRWDNIYAQNDFYSISRDKRGLSIGLFSKVRDGISFGLFSEVDNGISIGLFSKVREGISFGGLLSKVDNGISIGLCSRVFNGISLGLLSEVDNGISIGLYQSNLAKRGLALGLFSTISDKTSQLRLFPIVNLSTDYYDKSFFDRAVPAIKEVKDEDNRIYLFCLSNRKRSLRSYFGYQTTQDLVIRLAKQKLERSKDLR